MKFALPYNIGKNYYSKIDEIIIPYPIKNLEIPKNKEISLIIDFTQMDETYYSQLLDVYRVFGDKLKLVIPYNPIIIEETQKRGFKHYYFIELAHDYNTFDKFKKAGACDIRIGNPLTHCFEQLQNQPVNIRVTLNSPNVIYPSTNSEITAGWIRPEDIDLYSNFIDYAEFNDTDSHRLEALYRIYAERKEWPGEISKIIPEVTDNALNRLLPQDFGERRLNCRELCCINSQCHYCYRVIKMANQDFYKKVT